MLSIFCFKRGGFFCAASQSIHPGWIVFNSMRRFTLDTAPAGPGAPIALRKKIGFASVLLAVGGERRNKLAHCNARETGSRGKENIKRLGIFPKEKVPYLERAFSTGPNFSEGHRAII